MNEAEQGRRRITADDVPPLFSTSLTTGVLTALVVTVGTLVEDPRAATLGTILFLLILTIIYATIVILASAIAVGLPTAWLLRRFSWERAWSYVLVGFVAGASIWIFWSYRQETEFLGRWPGLTIGDVMMGGLPGAVCAGLWWMKTRQFRPGELDG